MMMKTTLNPANGMISFVQSMFGLSIWSHFGNVSGRLPSFVMPNRSIRMPKIVLVTNSEVNRLHQDADQQRDAEALHFFGAEQDQERAVMTRRHVGVEDGAERAIVSVAHRHAQRQPAVLLFAQALEDQHVCIDGGADRSARCRRCRAA